MWKEATLARELYCESFHLQQMLQVKPFLLQFARQRFPASTKLQAAPQGSIPQQSDNQNPMGKFG